jgi:hypothetical protein
LNGILKVAADSKNISKSDSIQIFMVAVVDDMFPHKVRSHPIFKAIALYASQHGYKWLVLGDTGSEPDV